MPTETADSNITLFFKSLMNPSQLASGAYCQENGFAALKALSPQTLRRVEARCQAVDRGDLFHESVLLGTRAPRVVLHCCACVWCAASGSQAVTFSMGR